MAKAHHVIPLALSGNVTPEQTERLRDSLNDSLQRGLRLALEKLDEHSARMVLDLQEKLQTEITSSVEKIIQRFTISEKYKEEEALSRREYPATYRVRPIEAQSTALRNLFPGLHNPMEKLARRTLPDGAEDWFAIPRWQSVAHTYGEAVQKVIDLLAETRRFSNRITDRLGAKFLRQSERSALAERIIAGQQHNHDVLVIAAQLGLLYRGCSARRARVLMATNEFALGAFAVGCLLLTHPERLSHLDTLMLDCGGDEYSLRGDGSFDRVPLFDFDLGGIEFSVFYEDRARNLWGTPTGFVFEM
jgi:hypothetical protein